MPVLYWRENENAPWETVGAPAVGGGGIQMELLWENASPTSEFAAQTITGEFDRYDEIRFIACTSCNYVNHELDSSCTNVSGAVVNFSYISQNGTNYTGLNAWARSFCIKATGIEVTCGYYNGKEDNRMLIPKKIYGIKGVQA